MCLVKNITKGYFKQARLTGQSKNMQLEKILFPSSAKDCLAIYVGQFKTDQIIKKDVTTFENCTTCSG